jgi:mannose-6-phosphate isomerase-like protein (cupin superfamily)
VLVTQGRMSFTIDDIRYDLGVGDSIHFRTVRPHSWANPTRRPARAVWLAIRGS